jgi:hypothetical protein
MSQVNTLLPDHLNLSYYTPKQYSLVTPLFWWPKILIKKDTPIENEKIVNTIKKKTLKQIGYENQRSMELAEGCVKLWASVIVVFNLQIFNNGTFLIVKTSDKCRFIQTVLVNSVVFLGIFCSPLHELNLSRCNSGYVFVSDVHNSLTSDKARKQTHHVFS